MMAQPHKAVVRYRTQTCQHRHILIGVIQQQPFAIGHQRPRNIKPRFAKVFFSDNHRRGKLLKSKPTVRFMPQNSTDMNINITQAGGVAHIHPQHPQQPGIGDNAGHAIDTFQGFIQWDLWVKNRRAYEWPLIINRLQADQAADRLSLFFTAQHGAHLNEARGLAMARHFRQHHLREFFMGAAGGDIPAEHLA